jgi:hypothetical protein
MMGAYPAAIAPNSSNEGTTTMMVDTRVYGLYIEDVGIVHNTDKCAGGDVLTGSAGWPVAVHTDNDEIVKAQPIYSIDDTDGAGTTCDGCGEFVFEPDPDYCGDHDEYDCEHADHADDDDEGAEVEADAANQELGL